MLGMPHTVESAPASSQEYSGTQQVNVVPTIAADRQLPGNATGTVTENWMAGELRSGSRAYQVNDRTVVALHTATPLYRDLKVGDRGEDVRSLNDELSRLGYDSVPQSGEYNRNTGNGWRQLMVDAGNSDGAVGHDVDSPGFGEGAGVERHSGQRGAGGSAVGHRAGRASETGDPRWQTFR